MDLIYILGLNQITPILGNNANRLFRQSGSNGDKILMSEKLAGLAYWGGKSPICNISPWINSILPDYKDCSYIEPFAGMLGVLLNRPKVNIEIVNDINRHLINWWLMVRDRPDEFNDLIKYTPRSREIFNDAKENIDNISDPLQRALAFHILITQSLHRSINSNWSISIKHRGHAKLPIRHERLIRLADRLISVQIENKDALNILERTKDEERVIVYCDPPYYSTGLSIYGDYELKVNQMAEILKYHKGFVAISGYADEWDGLGWEKSYYLNKNTSNLTTGIKSEKTEVLWTNFKPHNNLEFDF